MGEPKMLLKDVSVRAELSKNLLQADRLTQANSDLVM